MAIYIYVVWRGKEAFSTPFPYGVFLFLLSAVSPVDLEEEMFDELDVNALATVDILSTHPCYPLTLSTLPHL